MMDSTEDKIKRLAIRMAATGTNPDHIYRGTEDGRIEHIYIASDGSVVTEIVGEEPECDV